MTGVQTCALPIFVFIILILVYAILLNRLDNEYSGEVGKEEPTAAATDAGGAEGTEE